MRRLVANGAEFRFVDEGQVAPIVRVHGVLSDHRAWAPQRAAVSARHRFTAEGKQPVSPVPGDHSGDAMRRRNPC